MKRILRRGEPVNAFGFDPNIDRSITYRLSHT